MRPILCQDHAEKCQIHPQDVFNRAGFVSTAPGITKMSDHLNPIILQYQIALLFDVFNHLGQHLVRVGFVG